MLLISGISHRSKGTIKKCVVAWRQRASFASQHMFSADEADGAMDRQRDSNMASAHKSAIRGQNSQNIPDIQQVYHRKQVFCPSFEISVWDFYCHLNIMEVNWLAATSLSRNNFPVTLDNHNDQFLFKCLLKLTDTYTGMWPINVCKHICTHTLPGNENLH